MAAPLHPSTIIRRASPRLASILAAYADFRPRTLADACPSNSPSKSLLPSNDLATWQGRGMPILTRRQLEMSLLEIRRRGRRRERQTDEQGGDPKHTIPSPSADVDSARGLREAAILVPVCTVGGIPSVLFTRRSADLSSHASQISFPGGYYDKKLDVGESWRERLVHAALREMQEELQYDINELGANGHTEYYGDATPKGGDSSNAQSKPPFVTVLGQTQPVPSMTGHKVTPIVGAINYDLPCYASPQFAKLFPGNPEELDWIFTVPIRDLIETETAEPLERWKTNYSESGERRHAPPMGPVFTVPAGHRKEEGDKIWGLTAIVLRPLLKRVLGPVFEEECGGLDTEGESSFDATAKL
ncbi:hypothetical protein ACHAXT_001427 [Thalassiosira profunda]